jgi:2-C-methyl-D-erythritol 4-phosphate cytidylyltransferase
MKIYAIIPSGGLGKRVNSPLPKQFLKSNGKEIIAYTLEIFQNSDLIDGIIVATQKDFFYLLEDIKLKYSISKLIKITEGGKERQDSVFNALKSTPAGKDDLVVVHDAVRPLLSQNILSTAVETAKKYGSVVVAIKAKDTLINGDESVQSYIDRKKIYYAQTPQVFQYDILFEAMIKAEEDKFIGTDESILVHRLGYEVKIVEGSYLNFKITNIDDLKLFKVLSQDI